MKKLLLLLTFAILFACTVSAQKATPAQIGERDVQSAEVKAAIGKLTPAKRPRLRITLRSLDEFEANLSAVSDHSFLVIFKKAAAWDREREIEYRDVLALNGNGISISYIPDPAAAVHGSWSEVRNIAQNQPVGLVLKSGKHMNGFFGGADDEKFILLGNSRDGVMELPRASIVRVFGMRRSGKGAGHYTSRGMQKGSEVGAPEALLGIPIGAGIGALIGLAKQRNERLILVFAI